MNDTTLPAGTSEVPWPTSDPRGRVPGTSMPPGRHDLIDRVADRAAPAVQPHGEQVSAARDTLEAKADLLRVTRDAWLEGVRTTVRANPLASVAAALALGAFIARITR